MIVAFHRAGAPRYSASTNYSEPVEAHVQCDAPHYRDTVDETGTVTGWEEIGRCGYDLTADVYADGTAGYTWTCPRCGDDHREDRT